MSIQDAEAGVAIYRGMDRPALDAAYNNTAAVADSEVRLANWRERSARIRASGGAHLDLVYGARPRARIDYFSAAKVQGPLFVFIHGGYWQRNDKETFAFLAEGPRAHGINVAVVGYTLAPQARLSEIVGEIRRAIDFMSSRAGELGFDGDAVFVGGWSAGGHLATVASEHPAVRGALAISGIFDLEPMALSYINEKLALDAVEVATLSPIRNMSSKISPLRLCVGGRELPELRRQSADFADAARMKNRPLILTVIPDHDHFSILEELAVGSGALVHELIRLIEQGCD